MIKKFLALLLFGSLAFFNLNTQTLNAAVAEDDFSDKKIVWLGDSITVGFGSTTGNDFVSLVEDELNFQESINYAVGGAQISKVGAYSASFIDIAATMDTDADYVVVFGGVNDLYSLVSIGSSSDTDPTVSFYGGLNTLFTFLDTTYPTATIIIASPFSGGGANTSLYRNAMLNRSNHYEFHFLDIKNLVTFDLENSLEDRETYAVDIIHPNDNGYRHLADIFTSFLYPDYTTGNLYDPLAAVAGALAGDGTVYDPGVGGFLVSDYMPVEAGRSYVIPSYLNKFDASSATVSWYDSSFNHIQRVVNSNMFLTAPANAAYARVQTYFTEGVFWKIIDYDYEVSFNSNFGNPNFPNQYVTEYRDPIQPTPDPTRYEYEFNGWFTYNGSTYSLYNFTDNITEDTILYARWTGSSLINLIPMLYVLTIISASIGYITISKNESFKEKLVAAAVITIIGLALLPVLMFFLV